MKEKEKWTPHIIAVATFVVFIVLGLACASAPSTASNLRKKLSSRTAVYSKDGKFLITGADSIISTFDISTGNRVKKFDLKTKTKITDFLLSEDGRTLLLMVDANSAPFGYIYDIESGKIVHTIEKPGRYFTSPDGFRTMNSIRYKDTGNVKITITDTVSGAMIKEVTVPAMTTKVIVRTGSHFINNGGRFYDLIGYSHNNDASMWVIHHVDLEDPKLETGYFIANLEYLEEFSGITYSPDGKYMAISHTQSIFPRAEYNSRLADARKAANKVLPNLYNSELSYNMAQSNRANPFGFYLRQQGDQLIFQYQFNSVIRVINLSTGELAGMVTTGDKINFLTFSPDSKILFAITPAANPRDWYAYDDRPPINAFIRGILGANGTWRFDDWRPTTDKSWRPTFLCFTPDGKQMLVHDWYSDRIEFIDLE